MPYDKRTEENIATLIPAAQDWARRFMEAVLPHVPPNQILRIISGHRSYEEQNALYNKGRVPVWNEKKQVTNARGGQSNHNFGIAWDIGLFEKKAKGERYIEEGGPYERIGPFAAAAGLEWGGTWKSFVDYPHYEAPTVTNLSMAQKRALVADGKSIPIKALPGQPAPPVITIENDVRVYRNGIETTIPAKLENSRVIVGVRAFTNLFGGGLIVLPGSNFQVALNEETISLAGSIIKKVGYVRFADLNSLYDFPFRYEPGELFITD